MACADEGEEAVNALVLAFESEAELRVAEGLIGRIKGGDKSHKIPGQTIAMLSKCTVYRPSAALRIDQQGNAMVAACDDPSRKSG